MTRPTPLARPLEIELKLALPGADPRRIGAQLAAVPALAGLPAQVVRLVNTYFDTPGQHLRQQRAALRLRSVRTAGRTRWLQTLKTAGTPGALSQRGEWETALRRGALDPAALQGTPWAVLDPRGDLFGQLAPVFQTRATRTLREYTAADGSRIEVALDVGHVRAEGRTVALCELELELLHGPPDALFALAEQVALWLPVLPGDTSKAQRGWQLADGGARPPRRARPPALTPDQPVRPAAQAVLGEALGQFSANLADLAEATGLAGSDDAERVHQARVGWRRWRSALWLFRPVLRGSPAPDAAALRPLLDALGAARDLDVAVLDTLPRWADAYVGAAPGTDRAEGATQRRTAWQRMLATLHTQRRRRHAALRAALHTPATGLALLRLLRWVNALAPAGAGAAEATAAPEALLRDWAPRRARRLRTRLRDAIAALGAPANRPDPGAGQATPPPSAAANPTGTAQQHRMRLLAKRSRYVLESLRPLLRPKRTRKAIAQATALQTGIGATRDLDLLASLLATLGAERAIAAFFRGASVARASAGKGVF